MGVEVTRDEILLRAPLAPKCWPDRLSWAEYLFSAQEIKSAATKPFVDGKFNQNFNHCADCLRAHRQAMVAERRCYPVFVVRHIHEFAEKKEVA